MWVVSQFQKSIFYYQRIIIQTETLPNLILLDDNALNMLKLNNIHKSLSD